MRDRRPDSKELRKFQNTRLRAIVKHSYNNVPYYHALFKKAKLRPDDVKTIKDLTKLPIIKKKDLRDVPLTERVAVNTDINKCWIKRTSGTTGTPLIIYREKKEKLISYLQQYRWQMECGDKITNRQVLIGADWGLRNPLSPLGIFKTKDISPFKEPKKQIEEIQEFGPKTAIAFPSCVRVLAQEILEEGFHGLKIPLILTGAEMLDKNTRELVGRAFEAEVFESYGTTEVGRISTECVKHNGCHILSDLVLVEVIQDGEIVPTGEEGEIIVTNLYKYAMPFLRYNLEDLGMLMEEDCSCDNPYPLMRITGGRKKDFIQLPNGSIISATPVYTSLNFIQGLRQFQVIQDKPDRFTVKIVKDSQFTKATCARVKQVLKERVGNVELDVVIVDNIPREKSGKFKPFKPMKT